MGGKIIVGQHSVTHPGHQQIKSYIDQYGSRVAGVTYTFSWPKVTGSSISKENRCYDKDNGGPVLDLGVYGASFIHYILGEDYKFDCITKTTGDKVLTDKDGSVEIRTEAEI